MSKSICSKIGLLVFISALIPAAAYAAPDDAGDAAVTKKEITKRELIMIDAGIQCKRVKKIGSNRIQRVCTTAEERKKLQARNEQSKEWLEEQERLQQLYNVENQAADSVNPN